MGRDKSNMHPTYLICTHLNWVKDMHLPSAPQLSSETHQVEAHVANLLDAVLHHHRQVLGQAKLDLHTHMGRGKDVSCIMHGVLSDRRKTQAQLPAPWLKPSADTVCSGKRCTWVNARCPMHLYSNVSPHLLSQWCGL